MFDLEFNTLSSSYNGADPVSTWGVKDEDSFVVGPPERKWFRVGFEEISDVRYRTGSFAD